MKRMDTQKARDFWAFFDELANAAKPGCLPPRTKGGWDDKDLSPGLLQNSVSEPERLVGMTESEAFKFLFDVDLNAPEIRGKWGELIADIRRGGIVLAAVNLRHEINLLRKLKQQQ